MILPFPLARTLPIDGEDCDCLVYWNRRHDGTTELTSVMYRGDDVIEVIDPGNLYQLQSEVEYWLQKTAPL